MTEEKLILEQIGLTAAEWASQQHLSALGAVVNVSAAFEALVDTFALRLAGFDEVLGYCLTTQIAGPMRKLEAYYAIAGHKGLEQLDGEESKQIKKKMNKYYEKTRDLSEKRNRLVHDPRRIDLNKIPSRRHLTAKKKLEFSMIDETTDYLISVSQDIGKNCEEFIQLHDSIIALLGTLPKNCL